MFEHFVSQKHSTARDTASEAQFFRVTHPFHPLLGREFTLVDRRTTWGEDRVYFSVMNLSGLSSLADQSCRFFYRNLSISQ
ncbi:MAG: hypothetical protein KDI49_15190 [Gammaproteobacteria bacterium]|nr:hypothetical protein [Gammaproteobacteria bacterium]